MAAPKNPVRGSAHYAAKLTESDVALILQLAAERAELLRQARALSTAALAEKFEVGESTIERIVYGERWRHV